MTLQTIKSIDGKVEYVLLPVNIYQALRREITAQLKKATHNADYEFFNPSDYVNNPVALLRIISGITQQELSQKLNVTQAYISKIENQTSVSPKVLKKVNDALNKNK